MDSLTLKTATTSSSSYAIQLFSLPFFHYKKSRIISFGRKPRRILTFASRDEPKLDEWDQMELKFGRMLGEDPKVTLAKIMSRKSNPDMSYLEVEKLLDKGGKRETDEIQEVPFDVSEETKSVDSLQGINLVRPVPKKGVKFETNDKQVKRDDKRSEEAVTKSAKRSESSVPNVILRKPDMYNEEDDGNKNSLRFGMKPNLTLKMGKEQQKERFSDITLLKRPELAKTNPDIGEEDEHSGNTEAKAVGEFGDVVKLTEKSKITSPKKSSNPEQKLSEDYTEPSSVDVVSSATPEDITDNNPDQSLEAGLSEENGFSTGLQADVKSMDKSFTSNGPLEVKVAETDLQNSVDAALLGKPKRLDPSLKASPTEEETATAKPDRPSQALELENFLSTSPIKEHEDNDWARAGELVKTGGRVEVELISSSTRGFVVSFGSLVGFLPYRNLAAKWKFLAFESWLRRKGLDPSLYRQNLGIIGRSDGIYQTASPESREDSQTNNESEREISPDMKLEDLLSIYDQEKLKFLSSFVGQKIKVAVVLADRKSRRLIVSIKPKEKEELVERKRSLMAKLSVGDVVKCCIKKITYFGIFVEIDGVPALIHQTEVSWDATLDPAAYFKVGQIVEAKVHQLDFTLERIYLSLKEITPDPLIEALEAVVGDHNSLGGRFEAAQEDAKWDDVESLINELRQYEGIQSVSKGRYFLSPGLAPTFQVYMASIFENQYKLLARAGKRAQEVIVQTSLGKEDMKHAILTCTNRVV